MSATSETGYSGTFDMDAAPLRIGMVGLRVRDLDRVARFYRDVIGLEELVGGEGRRLLGVGKTPLLELAEDKGLAPVDPREAGLFHTAFLLPSRGDLGRWLRHAAGLGVRIGRRDRCVMRQ